MYPFRVSGWVCRRVCALYSSSRGTMERVGENEATEAPPFIPKDGYGGSGKMQGASSTPMLQVTRRKDQAIACLRLLCSAFYIHLRIRTMRLTCLVPGMSCPRLSRVEHPSILLGEERRQPPALPTPTLCVFSVGTATEWILWVCLCSMVDDVPCLLPLLCVLSEGTLVLLVLAMLCCCCCCWWCLPCWCLPCWCCCCCTCYTSLRIRT